MGLHARRPWSFIGWGRCAPYVSKRQESGVTKAVAGSPEGNSDKRDDAKKTPHRMIVTALRNCSEEAQINPASYAIIVQAIIVQVTQPHVTWVLKELSIPPRRY
jgi:hypothetical protein